MFMFRAFSRIGLVLLVLILIMGCSVTQLSDNDLTESDGYSPSEKMEYEPDLYGVAQTIEVADLLVDFCGIDVDRKSNLADVDTLEYWSVVYDSDTGVLLYATHVRINGLLSEQPDLRYDDDDGYALIATSRGIWIRESGSSKFEADNSFCYDSWLDEESIYLKAISLWDGSSKLFTPSSPASGSLILLEKIKTNIVLDKSLFEPKGE